MAWKQLSSPLKPEDLDPVSVMVRYLPRTASKGSFILGGLFVYFTVSEILLPKLKMSLFSFQNGLISISLIFMN